MKTIIQVLSEEERIRIHEATLDILENTGVRVETDEGRRILAEAGARVDDTHNIVRFPQRLIEASLKSVPKDFSLGARRPGADLKMNAGGCTLCLDGSGTMVLDRKTGQRRPATYADWRDITRLADAVDEIGIYWTQVDPVDKGATLADQVEFMCRIQQNFSKHIQDTIDSAEQAAWLKEVLQTVFGGTEAIRSRHPLSFLLCPQSPLMIDRDYTDAYPALKGLNMPAAIMPMPLMGATAPASMISTIVQGNCEVLSMLCLLQAHEPGVPIIYAPALAVMDPRSGGLRNASMEYSIMGAAATEMARYYGLPAESSPGGSDAHIPDTQCAFEGAAMALPTTLSWPDIFVGPGMLDGSMVSSLEQLLIDVEIFRYARQGRRGVVTDDAKWLTGVIKTVGPGGNYLCEPSTLFAIRSDEWFISESGVHESYEHWLAGGRGNFLDEQKERVEQILTQHEPLPLGDDVDRELNKLCERARTG